MLIFKKLVPVFILIACIIACSDEEEIFTDDPLVDFQLFNIDSLVKVNDSLNIVKDSILVLTDTLTWFNDSTTILSDSITVLCGLIDEGQMDLLDEKQLLEEIVADFKISIELLDDKDSIMQASNSNLSAIVATIESGNLAVSTIENALNGRNVVFSDSMTIYEVALSMNADSTVYNVFLEDLMFSVTVGYARTQALDLEERIEIRTSQINVIRHSFDSVKVECKNTACNDDETVIKLYF